MSAKMISQTFFIVAAILSLSAFRYAQQPCWPGCLDPTFGNGGMTITYDLPYPGTLPGPSKAVLQPDGKMLALGNAKSLDPNVVITSYLTRYNMDGSTDTTFGNAGFVYLNFRGTGTSGGYASAIGIQHFATGDRIVVAGNTNYQQNPNALRVERRLMNGSLDTSFATRGALVNNTGYAGTLVIQPSDQKIITISDMGYLVRLNANGTFDNSFGSKGIRNTGFTGTALALQPDGKIIVAGSTGNAYYATNFAVARFNTNGSTDNTFGTKGIASAVFYAYFSRAHGVKVDANNRIIAIGSSRPSSPSTGADLVMARFTANGLLDTTYNGSGKLTQDLGTFDSFSNIELQSNGKIIASGSTVNSVGNRDLTVVRYNYDGTLDTGFGTGGIVTTDVLGGGDYGLAAVIQIDSVCGCEKFVIFGVTYPAGVNSYYYAVAARYIL